MKRVDQILTGYAAGDAISREARCIQQALQRIGYTSEIYAPAEAIAADVTYACHPLTNYRATPDDTCIFHYSIGTDTAGLLAATPARRILRYHNITPPHFFRGLDDALADQLEAGLEQLPLMVDAAHEVWSVSDFNAEAVIPPAGVTMRTIPLFFDPDEFSGTVDAAMEQGLATTRNILYVGRMSPNKGVEELLLATSCLVKTHPEIPYRLILVGSGDSCPRYYSLLQWMAERLDLPEANFLGYKTLGQLNACYRQASVFVTASHHEGFCLPVVEAMSHDVPVIARHCGGIPQTMADSGVLFDEATPAELAALIHKCSCDSSIRKLITTAQQTRYQQLSRRPDTELAALLASK
jgi:glycosyltransferase involved in cell wall biosynthesis